MQEVLCPRCHKPNNRKAYICAYCRHDLTLNNDQPSDHLRYWLTRVIKSGGQGAVYAGIDQHGKTYAIKEMLDHFDDPRERQEAIMRFNSEAELLQQLTHPRIPRVYSHFTDEGRHYLTMDFVQGTDLDTLLEQPPHYFPEAQVLEWAMQISDVLAYLHDKGLIYRDVKPSNIMVEQDGGIKLVDFGIAKVFTPTQRGTQIGTPGYAPPEQYQGLATPQSDIYALAATLHHLLTGRDPTTEPPFSFPPVRDLKPQISDRTHAALQKALAMKPEDRYATMAEFRAALRPLIGTRDKLQQAGQVRVQPAATVQVNPAQAAQATPAAQAAQAAPATQAAQATPAAQAAQAAPAAPPPPRAAPRPARPAPAPPAPAAAPPRKPAPVAKPKQGRGMGGCVRTLINGALLLIALVVILVAGLMFLRGNLGASLPAVPSIAQPSPVPLLVLREIALEVEVTLPSTASEAEVREALRAAYRREVEANYPGAQINENIPPALVGSVTTTDAGAGQTTYRARLSGRVSVPEP